MKIRLVLAKEERLMSTDNGIPRVGDTIEFMPGQFTKVSGVAWELLGPPPFYEAEYVTHRAVIMLRLSE